MEEEEGLFQHGVNVLFLALDLEGTYHMITLGTALLISGDHFKLAFKISVVTQYR